MSDRAVVPELPMCSSARLTGILPPLPMTSKLLVSASALTALGLMLGLLLAGGVTIRPDHTPYLMKAQSALRKGQYVLAIHAENTQQVQEAKSLLSARNVKTVQTL